jgi:type I restriction enzyme S subunit
VARQPNESGVIENFDELFASNIGINGLKDLIISLGVQGRLTHNNQANPDLNTLFVDVKADRDLEILGGGVRDKGRFIDFDGLDSLKVNIPDSWCWVRLGAIAEVVRGGSPRPAGDIRFYDGHIPFLKVGDVTRSSGKIVEGWTATIKEAGLQKTRLVKGRTVLLTNSGATLGIPAICDFETTFNDGIAAFINLSKFVFDEYLHLYLTHLSDWFLNVAAQGQGQPNLNIDIIRSTWMPLPPIQEQFKIVSKVDELLARCDQLESLVENSSQLKRKIADVIVEQITK